MLSTDWSSLNYYIAIIVAEPTLQRLLVCNWLLLYLVVKGLTGECHDRKRWMELTMVNEWINNKWKNGSDCEAKGNSRRRPSVGREFTCLVSHWELWRRVWWFDTAKLFPQFSQYSSPLAIANQHHHTVTTVRLETRTVAAKLSSGYWLAARRTGNIV